MNNNSAGATTASTETDVSGDLVEVWGDTVSYAQLVKAILIGIVLSTATFYLGRWFLLPRVSEPALAHAYSMLFGLFGCLLAGFVCAKMFSPKREILQPDAQSMEWFDHLVAQWKEEGRELGDVTQVPESVKQELKELNLYDAFLQKQQEKK